MASIHEELRKEGYLVSQIIKNDDLEKGLIDVSLELARGVYGSVRIVPSIIAIRGWVDDEFIPDPPSHMVYVLYNPSHPKVKEDIKKCENEVVESWTSLSDREGREFQVNMGYREAMLNLKNIFF